MYRTNSGSGQIRLDVRRKLITSRDNPTFKLANSLGSRKGRDRTGKFRVEGFKLVSEALSHPELVETILVGESINESVVSDLAPYQIPMVMISSGLADALAETETAQGIWAICRRPDWGGLEAVNSCDFVLMLAEVQDPGNLGTILRTAWAVGIQAVLLSAGSVDPYNPKVIRSAMGATLNLPIFSGVSRSEVEALKEQDFRVMACDPLGETSLFRSGLEGKLVLIMGNEGQGLSPEWKATADCLLNIPLQAGVDSLNVAVACGIVLYEAYRQRNGL